MWIYAALFAVGLGTSSAAATFSGIARSIDGDSLMVGETEVRLFGIDAPELSQTCHRAGHPWACGSAAAHHLSGLVAGNLVSCASTGVDKHGRTLARCSVGTTELNRVMVASGYALAYRRYSMDYNSAEESAKVSRRGIWSSTFELPSEVRHAGKDYVISKPVAETPSKSGTRFISTLRDQQQSSGNCNIKGNHSRRGEWIYHLPGMPYYAQTVAEEMFCTEAQARAAGYRRSRADRHR